MVNGFVGKMTNLFITMVSFGVMAEVLFGSPMLGLSVIENVNVLGTGDMFAASFMNEYLNSKNKKLKEIVVNSHKEVTNYLEELVYEKS